jgi:hypothetical protein
VITRPDVTQLAELVREELRRLPDRDDAGLALADGLLGVVARRAAHQDAWMREEIEAVDDLVAFAQELDLGPLPDAATRRSADDADLAQRYRDRSAALDALVPVAMRTGGEVRARLDRVVAQRVAHEREIRGDVSIVRDAGADA